MPFNSKCTRSKIIVVFLFFYNGTQLVPFNSKCTRSLTFENFGHRATATPPPPPPPPPLPTDRYLGNTAPFGQLHRLRGRVFPSFSPFFLCFRPAGWVEAWLCGEYRSVLVCRGVVDFLFGGLSGGGGGWERMCSLQIECVVEFLCGGCGVGVGAGGAD